MAATRTDDSAITIQIHEVTNEEVIAGWEYNEDTNTWVFLKKYVVATVSTPAGGGYVVAKTDHHTGMPIGNDVQLKTTFKHRDGKVYEYDAWYRAGELLVLPGKWVLDKGLKVHDVSDFDKMVYALDELGAFQELGAPGLFKKFLDSKRVGVEVDLKVTNKGLLDWIVKVTFMDEEVAAALGLGMVSWNSETGITHEFTAGDYQKAVDLFGQLLVAWKLDGLHDITTSDSAFSKFDAAIYAVIQGGTATFQGPLLPEWFWSWGSLWLRTT